MEKTIDSSLEKKSESFTRRLVEFYTAEEWQAILGGFAENVARRTSTSTIWSLDETIELFKKQIEKLEAQRVVVEEELESLKILDRKSTWIKNQEKANFKMIAEKYNYAFLVMKDMLDHHERAKNELLEYGKKYVQAFEMANDYLFELCKLSEQIDGKPED